MKSLLGLMIILTCAAGFAQTATLRGQITDETGAVIPAATVTLRGPDRVAKTATSGSNCGYAFAGLANGEYFVKIAAPQLMLPQPATVPLQDGVQTLNLQMKAAAIDLYHVLLHVDLLSGTDPTANVGALVLRGKDPDTLADDPEDLAADLQPLASPSAEPNRAAFFIDGFSGGQLPSKESIRENRINQNPFSAEFDKLGFGRIEVFIKPGTDKLKRTGFYNFGTAQFRNLLNHTNSGPITGNIGSPLFGRANQSAGANSLGGTSLLESANNRRLELQARFTF